MPNYDYECGTCGNLDDAIMPVEKRDETRVCVFCGNNMRRVIHGCPIFITPYEGFMPQEHKDPTISRQSAHRRYKLKPGQGVVEDTGCRV